MGLNLGPDSKCDICTDSYSNDKPPVSIPCGHIYCLECLRNIHNFICPVCRSAFRPGNISKLHVDFESEEARKLQATVNSIGNKGIDETGLRDFIRDANNFLRPQPRSAYENLRASLKLIWCAASQAKENSSIREEMEEQFERRLEAEKRVHASAIKLYKTEKDMMQKEMEGAERRNTAQLRTTVVAYSGLMQKYESLMTEWETLREELRRVENERNATSHYPDTSAAFSEDVSHILSKKKPEEGVDYKSVFEVSTAFISPVDLPKGGLPNLIDSVTAEKMLRLDILSPCGHPGHPYECPCAPPLMKGRSGSLSSDSSSSPAGPETPPSDVQLPGPSGISLTAPQADDLEEPTQEPSTREHRASQRRHSKKSRHGPLPSTGKARLSPTVNPATAMSIGQDSEAADAPENQRLLSRLSDLLTDPTSSPPAPSSIPDSIPAGPLRVPNPSTSPNFDSLRSNRSTSSNRPSVRGVFTTETSTTTKRSSPVNMPNRPSTTGTPSHAPAPGTNYSSSNWQAGSVPGRGISSASDAARRAMEKQNAMNHEQTHAQQSQPSTSASKQAASTGPVPIPTSNRNRSHNYYA